MHALSSTAIDDSRGWLCPQSLVVSVTGDVPQACKLYLDDSPQCTAGAIEGLEGGEVETRQYTMSQQLAQLRVRQRSHVAFGPDLDTACKHQVSVSKLT